MNRPLGTSSRPGASDDPEAASAPDPFSRLREWFQSRGMAARTGFGERPALLIVDMQFGFTDPAFSLGAAVDDTLAAAVRLAVAARNASVPVIYTTCVWSEAATGWARKLPPQRELTRGSRWVQIDRRIAPQPGDIVLEKSFASAFFGTDLDCRLRALDIDTVLLAGVTTSGCVRASAVDACSYGYRVIVAREAVADRAVESHLMSLFDLEAKYADVVGHAEVEQYLAGLSR